LNRVLFFCDGGKEYGLGHVMRCIALAEEFARNGYYPEFVINGTAIIDNFPYRKLCPQLWPGQAIEEFCVIDSYAIIEKEMNSLWRLAKSCLWLDDENLRAYPGGVVVNPSLFGDELVYKNPNVRHLLGADYIILRHAFRRKTVKAMNEKINEMTIMMGGTDAKNLLPEVAKKLGVFHCKKNLIGTSQLRLPGCNMLRGLSAQQMALVFLRSDIVISAGGQTVNELIQMNTPAILIETAGNQHHNINAAVKRGLSITCMPDDIVNGVEKMDYSMRIDLYRAMKRYDFSNGVLNIVKAIEI